jgi:hypothetical protein
MVCRSSKVGQFDFGNFDFRTNDFVCFGVIILEFEVIGGWAFRMWEVVKRVTEGTYFCNGLSTDNQTMLFLI